MLLSHFLGFTTWPFKLNYTLLEILISRKCRLSVPLVVSNHQTLERRAQKVRKKT